MSDAPLTADERAELHALRDLRKTVIGFGGDDFTIMPWVDAHRLHKDEPYIGCVFCRDRFVELRAVVEAFRAVDPYDADQEHPADFVEREFGGHRAN